MNDAASALGIHPAEGTGGGPRIDDASERWSRTLIEVPDLVAVVDADGVLMYANAAAEALLGYEPAAEVGRDMFEFVHPDDRDSVVASFLETVAAPGTPAHDDVPYARR